MNSRLKQFGAFLLVATLGACGASSGSRQAGSVDQDLGRFTIRSVPAPANVIVSSANYTPSGAVLVQYATGKDADKRQLNLATMADDGSGFRPFFAQRLPDRPLSNGIRRMVFPDNRRIFTGDFVIECATSLETCTNPSLLPVTYPTEVSGGEHISRSWSEIVIGPDNQHIAWTTLLADYSAVVMTGRLIRQGDGYTVGDARIVSSTDLVRPDPRHKDGVLPVRVRGGEVKQFVAGGTALSLAGMTGHDIPDSVVQHLGDGRVEAITSTPGYTETTIFSPDERLGIVMTTRFSKSSDPAVLGLLPRPYPDSLKMDLSRPAYAYAVTGVRLERPGSIGPALIDIARSKSEPGYQGYDLNTDPDWVFYSPMSWHPRGTKAMWMEARRGSGSRRIQIVELANYTSGPTVAQRPWPKNLAGSSGDLSIIPGLAKRDQDVQQRVYGKVSGYLDYRRSRGVTEKTYVGFSDDGRHVYRGYERMNANPSATSVYTAAIDLVGSISGVMHLTVTFGPLGGNRPAQLIFTPQADGQPASRGYAEYGGRRLDVADLVP